MQYQNILFCTDYSDDADSAFVHALDQAVKYQARLHFLNVIPSVNLCGIPLDPSLSPEEGKKKSEARDERRRLEELGALKKVYEQRCQGVVDHTFVIQVGSPDMEIIKYADENEVDLIILGTAGRTILIIDDNADYLFTMETFLTRNGFSVLTAQDGQQGLELVSSRNIPTSSCWM